MKKFKVKVGERQFVVKAENEARAVKKLQDACAKDAEPINVEAIPYKNEMYVVLEYTYNNRKYWIVVAKENYHNEKVYTGGGSVEYSLSEAKKTADDFYTINKLEKKYGKTEGYKKWMAGETDSASVRDKEVAMNKNYVAIGDYIWLNGKYQKITNIEWGTKYAKVYIGNEWYEFDVNKIVKLKDSAIKDADVDTQHYAEYGWKVENDLARDCYWEAVEELAGTLKTEQDYIREIPKLAQQKFEMYVKKIKADFEKLISAGKSKTSNYAKWAVEQAKAIIKKQESK